jgi:hypothetical protein
MGNARSVATRSGYAREMKDGFLLRSVDRHGRVGQGLNP